MDNIYRYIATTVLLLLCFADNSVGWTLTPPPSQLPTSSSARKALASIALALAAGSLAIGGEQGIAAADDRVEDNKYSAFAETYDVLDGGKAAEVLGVNRLRSRAAGFVKGDVLEVAIGTALQTPFYDWAQITRFTGVDVSSEMLDAARARIARLPGNHHPPPPQKTVLKIQDVQRLSEDGFQEASVDTVIDTFSLCVIPDPQRALSEMTRVLKPHGGTLVLLENTISTNPLLRVLQDATEPLVTPFSKGCRWNVDVPALVEAERQRGVTLTTIDEASEQLGTFLLLVLKKD